MFFLCSVIIVHFMTDRSFVNVNIRKIHTNMGIVDVPCSFQHIMNLYMLYS